MIPLPKRIFFGVLMTKIFFRLQDASIREVNVTHTASVMQVAIQSNIRGIEAECGGACACATCHIYVDEAFMSLVPPAQEDECEMLDGVAAERRPNSRLACQIEVTPALDGLTVQIPDRQF
ncbi:2Fe-2S iron-sulfur cluster-binding protein [Acetobacter persici]|uniref:Ferredoxin n=1 Tax=Acetobacter persici TaxID=1076596 RepID=A0A6V8I8B7_9PROT|nr:2Fe-2S iron-sulfur cluster-binding protein [Acetobacter persici]GFE93810.1 ferredoxin [Acetobacter persici]